MVVAVMVVAVMVVEDTAVDFMEVTVVTEVVDMVVDMEATTVRVTALVPAFRYRCPLLVAGKLVREGR